MKRTHIIIGIVAVLIGMGFVMPAVAQWRTEGAMAGSTPGLFLLGNLLALSGIALTFRAIRNRRA